MTAEILFSDSVSPFPWSEIDTHKGDFGPKGAMLAALPRDWTLPFALVPASIFTNSARDGSELLSFSRATVSRMRELGTLTGNLIVRSSVVGESIWDRGSYESVVVSLGAKGFRTALASAVGRVLSSAPEKQVGLVLQSHIVSRSNGEFGNLLRISKTRDHWELSTRSSGGLTSRIRFNTQRDEAADPQSPLKIRRGISQERVFGSIGSWLNNDLLRGRPTRINCEWVTDNSQIYLVQLDEEDEDLWGVNPLQLRIPPMHNPEAAEGTYLRSAKGAALKKWDKLHVLEELWETNPTHRPTLFYTPLSKLPCSTDSKSVRHLEQDFRSLIGSDDIIVRTSGTTDQSKTLNLPRTECITPKEAARWCTSRRDDFLTQGIALAERAFVAHRFIAARASAWVRASPGEPLVEIHSLWGLPDALQFCPYDIWEVHVPTEVATDYPDYKSNILIPKMGGGWEYVRVKNELARSLSIGRRDAIDLATRTLAIVERLGHACHVMWFVGCVDHAGAHFSIPWYWTEAHEPERNIDRANYNVITITDPKDLEAFCQKSGSRVRLAIELKPTDLDLMRDSKFLESVGNAARKSGVPVILAGSTLAHAYYQLRRAGCTVIARGEKDHSRLRRSADFGKLVRDKIPSRIAERREAGVTKKVPIEVVKGFLTGKLLEEALEVRHADGAEQKKAELADLYEVLRALCRAENVSMDEVKSQAEAKRERSGGFEERLVLLQTGILGRNRSAIQDGERARTQVLARRISPDTYEIPFSFFGFMELDQARSLAFEDLGVQLDLVLKGDRIELHLSKGAQQLELALDLTVNAEDNPISPLAPRKGTLNLKNRQAGKK